MPTRLKWLPQAITLFENIYDYYSKRSECSAVRLYNRIIDSADLLKTFPHAGPLEPSLKDFPQNFHSFVVEKHYKLIYTISPDLIEIHAIWDCRQDDWKLKEMFR